MCPSKFTTTRHDHSWTIVFIWRDEQQLSKGTPYYMQVDLILHDQSSAQFRSPPANSELRRPSLPYIKLLKFILNGHLTLLSFEFIYSSIIKYDILLLICKWFLKLNILGTIFITPTHMAHVNIQIKKLTKQSQYLNFTNTYLKIQIINSM